MIKIRIQPKYIIIVISIIALFHNFNSPKNLYTILKNNYKDRLVKSYDHNFCRNESIGFLSYVKDKYNIQKSIIIKNFFISPDPSWFFLNTNVKDMHDDKMILLGFNEKKVIKFKKINDYFISKDIKKLNGIKSISFNSKKSQKLKFIIYQEFYGEKIKVYESHYQEILKGLNTISLNQSFKSTQSNAKIIVLFETRKQELNYTINNLKLYEINDFILADHIVYEKIDNCYLISRND
jgi:hypothetical protein